MILDRMESKLEGETAQEQAGFWPKRGMRDHITNPNLQMLKKT